MPQAEYLAAHKQLNQCAARTDQARTEMAEANLRLVAFSISKKEKYTNRRPAVSGFDSGRQHRPDARRGKI